MNGPATAWAKWSQATGDWHALADHCLDVAAVCAALLENPILRRRLARLGRQDDLDPGQRSRLAILAGLHDVGKANRGFQNRIRPDAGPGSPAGHVGEVVSLLSPAGEPLQQALLEALRIDAMLRWCAGEDQLARLLLATFWHHGRPVEPPAFRRDLWRATPEYDPVAAVRDAVARLWRAFPQEQGGSPLPATPEFAHAFMGLVTLADWLGSDTRYFPLASGRDPDRAGFARTRAHKAVARIGADGRSFRGVLSARLLEFHELFGRDPRPAQRALAAQPLPDGPSTLILEAETGSGKTEAALYWFARLFAAELVDGLYFALPTRAAARQIYRRVEEAARALFGGNPPPVILAVPGYLEVDGVSGRTLPGFEVLWPDDEADRLRDRGWAAERPKRYMAGTIVVGTVDQVLLSGLQVAHSHMRAAALLRHLLVVDEVHASDPYMGAILEQVLERHYRAGGHALLLSATLGGAARARFLRQPPPAPAEATGTPYPLLTRRSGGAVESRPVAPYAGDREVEVTLLRPQDAATIVRLALDAARAGARVAVLRNLVRDVQRLQPVLEALAPDPALLFQCAGVPAPHHGRYAAPDRRLLDRALEDRLGQDGPVVVAATQTIEQSLDLDFDFLITDLCPMDVLLQRLGRLHRHARPRPPGYKTPKAVVLVPERDLGSYLDERGRARGPMGLGAVYEDLTVVEATRRLLEEHRTLRLPAENRHLVEQVTHPEFLQELAEELGGAWRAHHTEQWGSTVSRRQLGGLNCVDWAQPLEDGRLSFDRGAEGRIGTRLGLGDRIARFDRPRPGPFGQDVREVPVPARLVPDAPADAEPEAVVEDDRCLRFRFGGSALRYDRLGLRRDDE
ncbi:MAG TPA: CRISPR-associated helicase Cas3' [Dehalococcoidia bacterium]